MKAIRQTTRSAKRFEQIVRILSKYSLADWLGSSLPESLKQRLTDSRGDRLTDVSQEARTRMALTELGTTFIKVGQVLSTRSDMISAELAEELAQLQADTPADSPETVCQTVERELGAPVGDLFAKFDSTAMASASIGQVHCATLHDGTEVVVKVQHAGIEEKIVSDLDLLARLAELAETHAEDLRSYRPRGLVEQFRLQLLQELDFSRELRSLERFRNQFADTEEVTFPKPYPDLSSQRVLTMEKINGVSVRKICDQQSSGVDTQAIAKLGAETFLRMIFKNGFYHADPHPGNLWIVEGGRLCLLDSGMVGTLDERTRGEIEGLLAAAMNGDSERMADCVVAFSSTPRELDRNALAADLEVFVGQYGGVPLEQWSFASLLHDLMEIIRRHRVILPEKVSLLLRVLVTLEGTARLLNPKFSLGEVMQPFIQSSVQQQFSFGRLKRKLERSVRDWDRLIEMLPRELTQVLLSLRDGTLDVHLEHRRLEATINRLIYGIVLAALILGATSLWSRQIPPLIGGISVIGSVLALLAVVMAWRLMRAIGRYGGLGKDK